MKFLETHYTLRVRRRDGTSKRASWRFPPAEPGEDRAPIMCRGAYRSIPSVCLEHPRELRVARPLGHTSPRQALLGDRFFLACIKRHSGQVVGPLSFLDH